jgi:DNA topoisomerase-3
MKLFLCEKPAQAKVLAQHLNANQFSDGAWQGDGVAVVAAQGHLMELALLDEYVGKGKWKIEDLPVLPNEWVLQVKDDARAKERFESIGRFLKQAGAVVLATDPDEEGELIGRDLLNAHNYQGSVSRLWASALNVDGLRVALDNLQPLSVTDGLYRAASLRRKLDWLLGMNLSRAYSVSLGKTTHIGRIKTRLLAELVRRERAIDQYRPTSYHAITAKIMGETKELHYFSGSAPALLGQDALEVMLDLKGASGFVTSIIEDKVEVAPPLPYSLSALLVDASLSGIGLSDSYLAAQALYLEGAISYPRSGSTELPGEDAGEFAAHSAIHTTGALPSGATDSMVGIYNLVQNNIQMQALGATTINRRTVMVEVEGQMFKLHEQSIVEEGFTKRLQDWHPDFDKYQLLKKVAKRQLYKKGEETIVMGVTVKKLETVAPAPFTEASILKLMLKNGIGTEATRVSSINSLLRDGVAVVSVHVGGPVILRATEWAQGIAAKLPASMMGNEMTLMVKSAQDAARRGDGNLDSYLLDVTKWILKVMPESEATA